MRDTFLKKGNNDEFIFLNSSRAIAQLVEQWIVIKTLKTLFFFDVFSQKHASFFKARCSNYFCQFFFLQNVTSSCHTKNKREKKRNEINDDDDDDDDEIGSGIIRL